MTRQEELTTETVQANAAQAGLSLSNDEAQELLNGIKRNRDMAMQVRALVTPASEPRPIFQAQSKAEAANRG